MTPRAQYAPESDGRPDPGEVVWTWVPFEDDPSRGKDRPVLVLAREREELLCLQLTSKDHDRDAHQEASWGRHWTDIGSGGWDRERRPSEVRLDKLLRVRESAVRREGAALDRGIFDRVVGEASAFHPQLRSAASGSPRPRRRTAARALDGAELGRRAVRIVGSLLRRR